MDQHVRSVKMEVRFHQLWIITLYLYIHASSFMYTVSESATIYNEDIGNLSCHKCEDIFKQWDPYTVCQIQPNTTPLVPCLKSEVYCMVERISIMGLTTSIKRECATDCFYGCRSKNFGVTTDTCTSCCQTTGCNTGNAADAISQSKYCLLTSFPIVLSLRHILQ
ncbi:uncharacterized protein LOC125672403 [Ostrea edulis]|uniref:uncharacterized protein LOC125672403 n=1 Tax=Ostrea edulis TaxID=37623 RepID=UPI0024AFF6F7|nr:uncharacterized protein LOC125672403 [Ostrea edulis]